MKHTLLFFGLFFFYSAFSQFNIGIYGAQQVFGAVSTVGREVVNAAQYHKSKKAQQASEAEFMTVVQRADSLFVKRNYREAIDQYNRALQLRQDEYVREQITRSTTEWNRQNLVEYEGLLDKADSEYVQLNYTAAIQTYTAALAIREEEYPRAKIERAKVHQEHWKTVQFSSQLISDTLIDSLSSRAYMPDAYSDFLPEGKYRVIQEYLLAIGAQRLNSIAVPGNVRLIVYSDPDYKGQVLLDITGPAIIHNNSKMNAPASLETYRKQFVLPLQRIFPQQVRSWSSSDMTKWVKGSMEISTLKTGQ